LTSLNIINTYKKFATDNFRGGQGGVGEFLLISGTTDWIIANDQNIQLDDNDDLLLSSNTCQDKMLLNGGTDKILLSGTTDILLIDGYCSR